MRGVWGSGREREYEANELIGRMDGAECASAPPVLVEEPFPLGADAFPDAAGSEVPLPRALNDDAALGRLHASLSRHGRIAKEMCVCVGGDGSLRPLSYYWRRPRHPGLFFYYLFFVGPPKLFFSIWVHDR